MCRNRNRENRERSVEQLVKKEKQRARGTRPPEMPGWKSVKQTRGKIHPRVPLFPDRLIGKPRILPIMPYEKYEGK